MYVWQLEVAKLPISATTVPSREHHNMFRYIDKMSIAVPQN